jgi:hypothetical protein
VQRFGGFVAKFLGDGVLIYFGYSQAHEDDAERAVRAGLELVTAVAGLKMKTITATALLRFWDMACSLSLEPLARFFTGGAGAHLARHSGAAR